MRWLNERLLGIDRRRLPPAWASTDVRAAGSRDRRAPARGSARVARTRRRALQRHVHELLLARRSAWRDWTCSRSPGFDVELAPLVVLRAAADLAGSARGRPAPGRRSAPSGCIRWPSAACRSSSSSPAVCRRFARTSRRCFGATRSGGRGASPTGRCCSRSSSRANAQAGARAARSGRRAVAAFSCTATVIRRRWAAWRRRRRCSAGFPARRSSISTPAAAAWPDRSATPAITSRCRARSASGGCCPPRAASATGPSWWRAARRAGIRSPTSPASRALHPAELIRVTRSKEPA